MKYDKNLVLDGPPVKSFEEMVESWGRKAEDNEKNKDNKDKK